MWDKFWKDKHGRVVIWQWPNPYLYGWVGLTVLAMLTHGQTADIFSILGSISLVVWALLEIFKGVNYFRRLLGLLVLVFAVATLIKSF